MNPVQVLLVEDNAGDAVLIRQVLAGSQPSVKLTIARDGEQAVSILADPAFRPDLIILDLNIPKVSGQTLLERHRPEDVPVVVFSTSRNEPDVQQALFLGAREYIQKPSDLAEFRETVHRMVDKWALRKAKGTAG